MPPEGDKPSDLHVNPCALILKLRPGVPGDAAKEEKMKARLIVDLTRSGLNPALADQEVKYGTVDLAISRMSAGAWLYVLDLADAFFNWRVHPEDANWLGFWNPVRSQYGRDLFLPNGLEPAPAINDRGVKEICRLLLIDRGVVLTDFVDDLFGNAKSENAAWESLRKAVSFF